MNRIITYLRENHIAYEEQVDLKDRTWIHRGGIVELWIIPNSTDELLKVCRKLSKDNTSFKLIGQTSNLYFKNNYNPSVIVSTLKLSRFNATDDEIICECGVSVKKLAQYAIQNGIMGFEGLVDLPGTVGAAIYNNSGCYQCSVSALLNHAEILMSDGSIKIFTYDDFKYNERSSIFKRGELNGIILNIHLKKILTKDKTELVAIADKNHQHRLTYQEKPAHTLGSIFPMPVYRAFEKNLSFFTRGLIYLIYLFRRGHIISSIQYTKAQRDIILVCNGLWGIRNYISAFTFNCFIWKDEDADSAFDKYKSFVLKVAQMSQTEIEIFESYCVHGGNPLHALTRNTMRISGQDLIKEYE